LAYANLAPKSFVFGDKNKEKYYTLRINKKKKPNPLPIDPPIASFFRLNWHYFQEKNKIQHFCRPYRKKAYLCLFNSTIKRLVN
jgi:hypothetical protein